MAYETFIPTVWNTSLNRELTGKHILAKHTHRDYEGDVKQGGDSVRILNVGKPTINSYVIPANKATLHRNLPDTEEIDNTTITMPIQRAEQYSYGIGDIDKIQVLNSGKVMAAYQQETAEGLAKKVDMYLGQTVFPTAPIFTNSFADATTKIIKVTPGDSVTASGNEVQNILELLDDLVQHGRENDISDEEKLYVAMSPKLEKLVRQRLISISTDNVVTIEGRKYLQYYNLYIEWSNNLKKVASAGQTPAYEYLTARTSRAVAYIHAHTHAEPFRPEKGFFDAIKGFILYDAMVIRPKEIFNVLVTT